MLALPQRGTKNGHSQKPQNPRIDPDDVSYLQKKTAFRGYRIKKV